MSAHSAALPESFYGVGVAALYTRASEDRVLGGWGTRLAAIFATAASLGYLVSMMAPSESGLAYAGWFVFVIGIVALFADVLAYGVINLRRPDGRRWALLALAVSAAPVAFFGLILAYKAVTGWWVTDPGLIAFGAIGATLLVGGGWLFLGTALLLEAIDQRPRRSDDGPARP